MNVSTKLTRTMAGTILLLAIFAGMMVTAAPASASEDERTAFDLFAPNATGPHFVNAYLLGHLSLDMYAKNSEKGRPAAFRNRFVSDWSDEGLSDFEFVDDSVSGVQAMLMHSDDATFVAFRGTEFSSQIQDVLVDLDALPIRVSTSAGRFAAHPGFWNAAGRVTPQIAAYIRGAGAGRPVWITGNSLGGAMAVAQAMRLELGGVQVAGVHHFGAPTVGDADFVRTLDRLVGSGRVQRWMNSGDPVTRIPPAPYRPAGSTNFFAATARGVTLSVGREQPGVYPISLNEHFQGRYNNNIFPHLNLSATGKALLPEPGPSTLGFIAFDQKMADIARELLAWYPVRTVADLLVREGGLAMEALVDALAQIGVTPDDIADVLLSMGFKIGTIADQLVRKGVALGRVAQALYAKVTTKVEMIVAELERLEAEAQEIVDALVALKVDADRVVRALFQSVTQDAGQIVALLADSFSPARIAQALDALGVGARGIVAALVENGASTKAIVDALEAIDLSPTKIAKELAAIDLSIRQIAEALNKHTNASIAKIAKALRDGADASYAKIVDALDKKTNASLNKITEAIKDAGAGYRTIMRALEDELDVTRFETATQIRRAGASVSQVVDALIAVYDATFESVIDVLTEIGINIESAMDEICEFFGC